MVHETDTDLPRAILAAGHRWGCPRLRLASGATIPAGKAAWLRFTGMAVPARLQDAATTLAALAEHPPDGASHQLPLWASTPDGRPELG